MPHLYGLLPHLSKRLGKLLHMYLLLGRRRERHNHPKNTSLLTRTFLFIPNLMNVFPKKDVLKIISDRLFTAVFFFYYYLKNFLARVTQRDSHYILGITLIHVIFCHVNNAFFLNLLICYLSIAFRLVCIL